MVTPDTSTPKLDVKRRECTLSEKMQELMLRQLMHELYNHNLYRTFANFFAVRGFAKLEAYYIERAQEEMKHHDWVFSYLTYNDAEFDYPTIPGITEEFEEMIDPFKLTVDKEISTTQMINEMSKLALDEGDYGTFNWLMGGGPIEGKLQPEQIEEESLSRTALDIMCSDASWLTKEKSLIDVYKNDLD